MDQPLKSCWLNILNSHLTEVLISEGPKEHSLEDGGGDCQDQFVSRNHRAVGEAEPDVAPLLLVVELAYQLRKKALPLPPVLPFRFHCHAIAVTSQLRMLLGFSKTAL